MLDRSGREELFRRDFPFGARHNFERSGFDYWLGGSRLRGSAQLDDQAIRIVQMGGSYYCRPFHIENNAGDIALGLSHTDLFDQVVRHRNDRHILVAEIRLGSDQVEEKPFGILQAIGPDLKSAIGFDRDTSYVSQGPEPYSFYVVRFSGLGRDQPAHDQQCKQHDGTPDLVDSKLGGEVQHKV
jgi:hypothetical protein